MQNEKEYMICRELNSHRCESVGEYSLPDYNDDVRKILAVKTKVFPSGKFVTDESLEFSGTVSYEIVYIDAENELTHAEFSTDYDSSVRINAQTYVDSDVKTSVSNCNVRLVGPRKLSVKCLLDNDVSISERRTYFIEGDAFMEHEPESMAVSLDVLSVAFLSGEMREMSDELTSIEGAIVDEVELLLSEARFDVDSLELADGTVRVKGEINVSALLKNADSPVRMVRKQIPYTDELPLADSESFDELDARVEINSLKTALSPTEDGVSVTVSLGATTRVKVRRNCAVDVVSDAYLKERATANEYLDFNYTEHVCTETKEEKLEFKRPLSELYLDGFSEIMYADAVVRVEKCEILEKSVEIQGEICFSGIACQVFEDGGNNYAPVKFTAPFVQNVNINCQIHDNLRPYGVVSANDVKINIDADELIASLALTSCVTLTSDRKQRCLGASYLTDEEYVRDDSVVTVYYPDSSENLFEIAKKFHTSPVEIAEENRLSEAVFASVDAPVGSFNVRKLLIK